MSSEVIKHQGRLSRRSWLWIMILLALFLGANVHLLYVAITSTPDCVSHLKAPDEAGSAYRAARSSC
ncbi:hypothetical protein EMQ25_04360 [Arsenicitalea aurantiaca]|uniref:Uncharacterized protein n=1 Tax=Arsenicitalea aurantiaca TaxID=1783274 RepID=A0A433XEA5_9HYPH|nr:hypothetical protein [Arsenicitalea aurantiaca]RUT32400.1 hypothetical protein EMQ25_04360 [Arsenicitalea aurantiaca]